MLVLAISTRNAPHNTSFHRPAVKAFQWPQTITPVVYTDLLRGSFGCDAEHNVGGDDSDPRWTSEAMAYRHCLSDLQIKLKI